MQDLPGVEPYLAVVNIALHGDFVKPHPLQSDSFTSLFPLLVAAEGRMEGTL